MALLNNPLWQFIINVFIGLFAIFVSVIIYRRQQNKKSMSYRCISATSLLSVDEEVKGQIKVLYKDKAVGNVRLIILKIWNSGNTPILPQEYIDPIKFEFGDDEEILDADVFETVPSNIEDRARASIRLDTKSVILEPLLLNSKDSITFRVLLTQSKLTRKIMVHGRIVGVNQIINIDRVPPVLRPILRPVARIVIYVLYLIFLSSVVYLIISRYEHNFLTNLLLIVNIIIYGLTYIFVFILIAAIAYSFSTKIDYLSSVKYLFNKFKAVIKYMIYEDN